MTDQPVRPNRLAMWLSLALVVVVLDQLSKWTIVEHFALGQASPVTSFFNLARIHNTGAAFSFLASAGGWQRWFFTGLGLVATVFITVLLRRFGSQRLFAFSLSLIVGGALGNVMDRARYGYVVDFLDFHASWLQPLFYAGHFPAFNLADSAITAGVVGLILEELLKLKRQRTEQSGG